VNAFVVLTITGVFWGVDDCIDTVEFSLHPTNITIASNIEM
jgi:hypothetical protein